MMFTSVLAVALAALAVSAKPQSQPSVLPKRSYNPMDVFLNPLIDLLADPPSPAPSERLTNAQRMARGLPPNKPNFAARGVANRRAMRTPCVANTGVIAVAIQQPDGSTQNTFLGPPNSLGEFQANDDIGSALQISFCAAPSPTSITIVSGGFSKFPYLAFITGSSGSSADLGPGSPNYASLGASTKTPRGSVPIKQDNSFTAANNAPESVETDIWTVDPGSGAISPSWINSTGDEVSLSLLYVPSANAFFITGDAQHFIDELGPAYPAAFSYLAASSEQPGRLQRPL